jgi:hypothetical protein
VTLSFPLTPDQYASKVQALKAQTGIDLTGNEGTVEVPDTSLQIAYDWDTTRLTVTISGGSWFERTEAAQKLEKFMSPD